MQSATGPIWARASSKGVETVLPPFPAASLAAAAASASWTAAPVHGVENAPAAPLDDRAVEPGEVVAVDVRHPVAAVADVARRSLRLRGLEIGGRKAALVP